VRSGLAALLAAAVSCSAAAAEQLASYRGQGEAARLFEQYDNDGYSLAVSAAPGGGVELSVRVSDAPLDSRAPFPNGRPRERVLPRYAVARLIDDVDRLYRSLLASAG